MNTADLMSNLLDLTNICMKNNTNHICLKKIIVNIVFLKNVQMIFTDNQLNKLVQQCTKEKNRKLDSLFRCSIFRATR